LAATDPAVAAAAWLGRIPAPQRLAADAYVDARLAGWAAAGLIFLALCWLVTRTGALARLRRALEAEQPRPWITAAVLTGVLTLTLASASNLVSGVSAWRGDAILARGGGGVAPTRSPACCRPP
jgi:hypothetical protein